MHILRHSVRMNKLTNLIHLFRIKLIIASQHLNFWNQDVQQLSIASQPPLLISTPNICILINVAE
jgi:hypothetical protein